MMASLLREGCLKNKINMDKEIENIVQEARKNIAQKQEGAVWLAMVECADFLNLSQMARHYFGKSANWLLQRLHGYNVNGKPAKFTEEQVQTLSNALNDLAGRLAQAAQIIESAK